MYLFPIKKIVMFYCCVSLPEDMGKNMEKSVFPMFVGEFIWVKLVPTCTCERLLHTIYIYICICFFVPHLPPLGENLKLSP